MVLGRGVARKERTRMDGEPETAGKIAIAAGGRAQHPSPFKVISMDVSSL